MSDYRGPHHTVVEASPRLVIEPVGGGATFAVSTSFADPDAKRILFTGPMDEATAFIKHYFGLPGIAG